MKYLIDTNTLSNSILKKTSERNDIFVLQEVVDEYAYSDQELNNIARSNIQRLYVSKKHIDKLVEILKVHGDNFDLIRLYTNEGTSDVLLIAYILAERDKPESLFSDEFTIVTRDKELIKTANSYDIKCISNLN
jgi:hypothetical protein